MLNNLEIEEIENFLSHVSLLRKLSQNTIRSYRNDLIRLYKWKLNNEGSAQDFIVYALKEKLSHPTVKRMVATFRQFNLWLYKHSRVTQQFLHLDHPQSRRKIPATLTTLQIDEIIKASSSIRDKALIDFLYSTGARVSEVLDMKLEQIDFDKNLVKVHGKGQKDRTVPVSRHTLALVSKYLASKGILSQFVFTSKFGTPLKRESVYRKISKLGKEVGIKLKIGCHTLRHSYATHLLERGANIMQIKELLGHERVSTTEVYLHCSQEHLQHAYELHPRYR